MKQFCDNIKEAKEQKKSYIIFNVENYAHQDLV